MRYDQQRLFLFASFFWNNFIMITLLNRSSQPNESQESTCWNDRRHFLAHVRLMGFTDIRKKPHTTKFLALRINVGKGRT